MHNSKRVLKPVNLIVPGLVAIAVSAAQWYPLTNNPTPPFYAAAAVVEYDTDPAWTYAQFSSTTAEYIAGYSGGRRVSDGQYETTEVIAAHTTTSDAIFHNWYNQNHHFGMCTMYRAGTGTSGNGDATVNYL
jgi:hypothetical protein